MFCKLGKLLLQIYPRKDLTDDNILLHNVCLVINLFGFDF